MSMKKSGYYFMGLPVYVRDEIRSERYDETSTTELHEIYETYSTEKEQAYQKIRCEMADNNGFGMCVWRCGSWTFGCAYRAIHPETGELLLVWHTRDHVRVFQY